MPLRCAQEFDSFNEGRDYWLQGCPEGESDSRKQFLDRRQACYRICVDSLSIFDVQLDNAVQKGRTVDDAEAARTRAYQLAFESQDQIFHSFFYDWLISRGMTEELLQVCAYIYSPFPALIIKLYPVSTTLSGRAFAAETSHT